MNDADIFNSFELKKTKMKKKFTEQCILVIKNEKKNH
jgi:hypothetical protein